MKLFAINKIFIGVFFALAFILSFYSGASAQTDSLNLTGEYSNNPTKEGFQIVPKCTHNYSGTNYSGGATRVEVGEKDGQCDWLDLLSLVRNIMTLMLFLSATIAVLSFIYAGFLYMTSFGDMGKVEQAHSIFSKVIIGFLFVFLGWLIVATILKTMGVKDGFSLLNESSVEEVKDSN